MLSFSHKFKLNKLEKRGTCHFLRTVKHSKKRDTKNAVMQKLNPIILKFFEKFRMQIMLKLDTTEYNFVRQILFDLLGRL